MNLEVARFCSQLFYFPLVCYRFLLLFFLLSFSYAFDALWRHVVVLFTEFNKCQASLHALYSPRLRLITLRQNGETVIYAA